MINNNEQDRIQMAKNIAEVRRSGRANMFDRRMVIECLYDNGNDSTAKYIEENEKKFMNLLRLSGDY